MKHALYVIGEPGSGKSTLVETLVGDALVVEGRLPLAHQTYLTTAGGVVELGRRGPRVPFGGTDTLSMSAIVRAEAWVMDDRAWPDDALLLAEGDRLACDRFFKALVNGGWDLLIAHLDVPPEVAAARRAARGSAQSESWVKGRRTKVANLLGRWTWPDVYTLDGEESPEALAAELALATPVAANLYGKENA